jgi:hypothetical protein
MTLHTSEVEKLKIVKEIAPFNSSWKYKGWIKGYQDRGGLVLENLDGQRIFSAEVYSDRDKFHLFWESLPCLDDGEYGLEIMDADAYYVSHLTG